MSALVILGVLFAALIGVVVGAYRIGGRVKEGEHEKSKGKQTA